MPDFPIIDAHVHLYDPNAVRFDWMVDVPQLNKPHLPADFDAARGSVEVEAMVFAEVDAADGAHLDEAKWVHDLMQRESRVKAMVASAPLEKGAAVEGDLAALAALGHVRGIRRLIQGHVDEPGWCLRDGFVEAVQLLPRHGFSFDICIKHPQMADAIELVRRCPQVQFVLDHIGKPGIAAGLFEPWASQMKALAAFDNVSCKLSGVVTEADHGAWTHAQVISYVAHTLSCFGFDRVMFGGDWPVLELAGRYAQWVAVVDAAVAGETAENILKLYRDNAVCIYRL